MGALFHLTFEQWLKYGIRKGYCSEQFCSTHDIAPVHHTEVDEWDNGGDPCAHVVRLGSYDDWDLGE